MVDVNVRVPAVEKLIDYAASGIGSIAGPILAPWMARREVEANLIFARGQSAVLGILAEGQAGALPVITAAQKEARLLAAPDTIIQGELTLSDAIQQRWLFQEEKRLRNIEAIVNQAASKLGDATVPDHEPDHDWIARFFGDVQDVSSEQIQTIWGKVLAGEVRRPGSTSLHALAILKNLDQEVASTFSRACSLCSYFFENGKLLEARIISFNSPDTFTRADYLDEYGFQYGDYLRLTEYGLTHPQRDTRVKIPIGTFRHQNKQLRVDITKGQAPSELDLSGFMLTQSGRELSQVVDIEPTEVYTRNLQSYFEKQDLLMVDVDEAS